MKIASRAFRRTVLLASSFLAVSATSSRATEFADPNVVIDTVVADTNFQIPLTRLPVAFENFRYPYVDANDNVLFIGNDSYSFGAKENGGIYYSDAATDRIVALVKEEDVAPDDGKPFGIIMGLQTDQRSLTFHRGPARGIGLYAFFDGGPLTTIANTATAIPGGSGYFSWFQYSDVSGDLLVFNAAREEAGTTLLGLYLYRHGDRRISRLLDPSQPVPAANGALLIDLSEQPRIDPAWVVFSAGTSDGAGKYLGRGILGWPLDAPTTVGETAEERTRLDRLQILAPFGMVIPDSGGRKMTGAPNPVVDRGTIAVVAGSDPEGTASESPDYQSICIRTRDGVWHNPVDTDTYIPNRDDGAVFTSFNQWIAVDDGRVIFRAHGPDGYEAIFIYDVETDTLSCVADTTRQIEGKAIQSFEVSTHPLAGRRLALMVRFADRTSGEYLATLPGLPVPRLRTPAPATGN